VAVKILDIENGQNLSASHNFSYVEGAYVYFAGRKIVCSDGQSGENRLDAITYSGGGITVDNLNYAYDMDWNTFRSASLNGTRITEKRLNQILAECKETETIYSVFGNNSGDDTAKILAMTVNISVTARPTAAAVLVNGRQVTFDAYNISDNNYFKLRDLAFVLSGTGSQFEVRWDSVNNAIILTSGQAYTPVGGEMEGKGAGDKTAVPTAASIYLNGNAVTLTAYNIGNNNYFKLRDVAAAIGFAVDWDGASQAITIDTFAANKEENYNSAYELGYYLGRKNGYLCGVEGAIYVARGTYDHLYTIISMYIEEFEKLPEYEEYQNFDLEDYMSGEMGYNDGLSDGYNTGFEEGYDRGYSDFYSDVLPGLSETQP
jgi:hypothetical protein